MAHHSSQNTSKHVSGQLCVDRREHTMGSLFAGMYVCVHMCHVVNLCQLCVAVPLTYDPCIRASAADGTGATHHQELGPLRMITIIKSEPR